MMTNAITPILLPKWGMDMESGKIGEWLVGEGEHVTPGAEVLEIESEKVTNVLEATASGILRRQLVHHGETHPVGTLLGVIADEDVTDDSISGFISDYRSDVCEPVKAKRPKAEVIDDMVEINGQHLHYISVGQGAQVVVLIHGFGGNLSTWGGLPMALASSQTAPCRVINIELPGHGTSSKNLDGGGGSQAFARLLFACLDKLGVGDVHLVGHSLGGTIAGQMAAFSPERIQSLTLISNYGLGTKVDLDYIEEFTGASRRKPVKLALTKLFTSASLVNSEMIEAVLRVKRLEGAELALRTIADNIRSEQPKEAALLLPPVPVQVILGKNDKIINFDDRLLADIDRVSYIENASHMPQLEQPAQTELLIKTFLEQNQEYINLQA